MTAGVAKSFGCVLAVLSACGRLDFDIVGDGATDGTSSSDASLDIVRTGLVLDLDPGDRSSYPGSGTLFTDLSPQHNDGTLVGAPVFTDAGAGSYFTFNGSDTTYITLGTPSPAGWTFGKTPRTLCGWAYLTTSRPGYSLFFSYGDGADSKGSYLGTSSDGTQWNFGGFYTNQLGGTVSTGDWVLLTGVWDGTTAVLYLDDTMLSANPRPTWDAIPGGDAKLGLDTNYAGEGWQGRVGRVLYYARALDATEVARIFAATRARYGR